MQKIFSVILFFCLGFSQAQIPEKLNASEIHHEIQKLNFLGSVLYLGAHPDDENTRLISYFSNEKKARTAYLSITRGDGGQNLIGPELSEELGVIRTQELLAARRMDGGQQFFTRAKDFGFSKNPEETLEIWNKDKVLSDVVWVMRKFKPDVVVNRFDHRSPGTTHGHHTSSAILSLEAFDLASNPEAYPDQLESTAVANPKRAFFNTSYWFYGSREAFEEADKSDLLSIDMGVYFPQLGLSNSEIAALSRSQHQSQGFGSTGTRGKAKEYLELLKGEMPKEDIFEGIDTSWNRIKGGQEIGRILYEVEKNFDFTNPAASLEALVKAYTLLQNLEDQHWKAVKTEHLKEIIAASAGLYLEAVAQNPSATPGEQLPVDLEAINRCNYPIGLKSVELKPNNSSIRPDQPLENNLGWHEELELKIPENADNSSPYWLRKEATNGMFQVADRKLIGLPENPLNTKAIFTLDFDGTEISFEKPVVYKFNDAVVGESYRPFTIIPEVSVSFDRDMLIFQDEKKRSVSLQLTAGKKEVEGTLRLEAGKGWKIQPQEHSFKLDQKGSSVSLHFDITPPGDQQETFLKPVAEIGNKEFSEEVVFIDYEHIPQQTLVLPAKLKLARLDLKKNGENIGYIEGAGDVVPESLEQIGYRVTKISPSTISAASLKKYDAVVVGIRAYNTVEELKYRQGALLEYVKNGGNLILQYNTSQGMLLDNPAPYLLKLSRDRVTDERSQVRFLAEDHPVLNTPNKITNEDFKGWVQERGLYFPEEWGEAFTPVLSMNDKNETPKEGSLLVAEYGEGFFIYTGLSFFRQFPAGVPGAFRLFTNLISIGKE